jgi:hypothetical protein
MKRAADVAAAAVYSLLMAGCWPAPAPVPLVPLEEGDTFALLQSPPGASLHFKVEHESRIAGEAYVQVQVTLVEGDEVRDAGHLFVRQTGDGLYWRLTDSAHTLLQPGFFRYPAPPGATYTFGDARYRVGREQWVAEGVAHEAIVYEQTKAGVGLLRVSFVPGIGLAAIESGAFRFDRLTP